MNINDIIPNLPVWALESHFVLKTWQWPAILILIFVSFIIEKVFDWVLRYAINKKIAIFKNAPEDLVKKTIRPLGKIISLALIHYGIALIFLNEPDILDEVQKGIIIIMSLAGIWFAHKAVEMLSYVLAEFASKTANKFDDILIPLLTKTAFIVSYTVGIVVVAHNLGINVTGIVAGLGIGGLAFAFAAKDTIANFFGSIMLVLDRPFDIGDVITAGDIEGTVVEVGFRSTRVRTFYDSIITVSNGTLMNLAIDNKGKRRYRRLNTTLGLEYDTPPQKVEAFCEGIRQIILSHKWTRKDNFNVYFCGFGASSLDIQLMVFWETDDYAREVAEKHRLMVDILRLSKELQVDFAFPTQTVHLFKGDKVEKENLETQYIDTGIDKGKKIGSNPLTLKNPRSNAKDSDQFGNNDVGI